MATVTKMIVPFKGRKCKKDATVEIYRNLNRRDGVWFSVRYRGKVIGHTQSILLRDATFEVHQAGRARCLREKRRNVHAWVRGVMCPQHSDVDGFVQRVYYRPHDRDHFHTFEGTPVRNARLVVIGKDGISTWRLNDW